MSRSLRRPGLLAGLGLGATAGVAALEVVERRGISRTSSLLVVRAGDRYLLLGVTPQSVQLVAELSGPSPGGVDPSASALDSSGPSGPSVLDRPPPRARRSITAPTGVAPWMAQPDGAGSTTAWDAFLATLRERTVRH